PVPVIGFDMGGTSTDVSRFDGQLEHVFETTTAGVAIQAPQLDINTVAAGGGSRLFFRNGLMVVGPESAGAHPGPACYRKGGPLAVTDANLVLGRLRAEHFPHIFGPSEDQPLDVDAARALFEALAADINAETRSQHAAAGRRHTDKSAMEIALGFVQVANETMCRPIRALTEARGHSMQVHALASFGGAGGQHACAVAASLGVRRVFVHRLASVLSAYGLGLAKVVCEEQAPAAATWAPGARAPLLARLAAVAEDCRARLRCQGFAAAQIEAQRFLNMRYDGTDTAIMVPEPADGDYGARFEALHRREFGFVLGDRRILIDDLRVRATGAIGHAAQGHVYDELGRLARRPLGDPRGHPAFAGLVPVYFHGGLRDTAVLSLDRLAPGDVVAGPAIVLDRNSTVLVEPGWTATAT
ncbi:hypothetical protein IWQ56_006376, partial [Coemansia nantahalensis]